MCEEMCISQINMYVNIYILEGQGVGIIVYDKNKKKTASKKTVQKDKEWVDCLLD